MRLQILARRSFDRRFEQKKVLKFELEFGFERFIMRFWIETLDWDARFGDRSRLRMWKHFFLAILPFKRPIKRSGLIQAPYKSSTRFVRIQAWISKKRIKEKRRPNVNLNANLEANLSINPVNALLSDYHLNQKKIGLVFHCAWRGRNQFPLQASCDYLMAINSRCNTAAVY